MIIKFEIDSQDDKFAAVIAALTGAETKAACKCVKAPEPVEETLATPFPPSPFRPAPAEDNPIVLQSASASTPPVAAEPATVPVPAPQPIAQQVASPVVNAPVPAPAAGKTLEDIKAQLMQLEPTKRVAVLQGILDRLGVAKLSEIPAERLDWVFATVQAS
jgi:hypothetical protein